MNLKTVSIIVLHCRLTLNHIIRQRLFNTSPCLVLCSITVLRGNTIRVTTKKRVWLYALIYLLKQYSKTVPSEDAGCVVSLIYHSTPEVRKILIGNKFKIKIAMQMIASQFSSLSYNIVHWKICTWFDSFGQLKLHIIFW